jgi:hypothetical protein
MSSWADRGSTVLQTGASVESFLEERIAFLTRVLGLIVWLFHGFGLGGVRCEKAVGSLGPGCRQDRKQRPNSLFTYIAGFGSRSVQRKS